MFTEERNSKSGKHYRSDEGNAATHIKDSAPAAKSAKGKKFVIFVSVLLCIFAAAWFALSHVDFLGEVVRTKVNEIAAKEIDASISLGNISGNPITGFSIADISVSREGRDLVTAKRLDAAISFSSLLTGNPKLSYVAVSGAKTSIADVEDLIPESQSDEPIEIPIKEVEIADSILYTDYGDVQFGESTVEIENSQSFVIDASCSVLSKDLRVQGDLRKAEGVWRTDALTAAVEEGEAEIEGALYPSPDAKIAINDINLTDIADIIPQAEEYGICGILSGRASVSCTGENIKDIKTSGSGTLHNALVKGIPIENIHTEWDVKPDHISVTLDSGKIFDSSIAGKFRLDSEGGKDNLELKLNLSNLKFADWTPKFEEQTGGNAIHLKGGISSLSADLAGPLDALVGEISLAPSEISYNEIKVTSLAGRAKFEGKPAGEMDFSGSAAGKNVSLKGILSFGKKMPSNFALAIESFPIEKIIQSIPQAGDVKASGAVTVKGTCCGIFGSWIVDASASSPVITADKIGSVSDVSLTAAYDMGKNILTVKKSSAVWNGARLTAAGTAAPKAADNQLNIGGTFANAKLDTLSSILSVIKELNINGMASGKFKVSGNMSDPKLNVEVNASDGRFLDLSVARAKVGIEYSGNSVRLDPIDVSACGGRGLLTCDVALPQGDESAKWRVKGSLSQTGANVIDGILRVKSDLSGKVSGNIEAGNVKDGVEWKADLASDNLKYKLPADAGSETKHGSEIKAQNVTASAEGNPREIVINRARGKMFNGELALKGKITMPQGDAPFTEAELDISTYIKQMNLYEFTRRHFSDVRNVQGLISTNAKITGKAGNPNFEGSGRLAPFRFRSFLLPMLNIKYHGNKNDIVFNEIKAMVRKGSINAYARLSRKDEDSQWKSEISANAKDVDMHQFIRYLPESFREGFGGNATFSFKGGGKGTSIKGKGEFSSPQLKIMGIKFDGLKAPFFVTDKYVMIEDLSCKVSGGKLNGGFGLNLDTSEWGSNCTLMGAGTAKILREAMPDLKGTITGTADVKARFGGVIGRSSMTGGGIAVQMHDGEVKSFDVIEKTKKLTRGAPLRFKTVQASITYDAGDISILPGTQAKAPDNDTVYNYAMLDGFMSAKGNIQFFAMGKVNVHALNSLIGTFDALASTGADYINDGEFDKSAMVKSILGSVVKGITREEFRFVTLNVKGTKDDPQFYNIKLQNTGVVMKSAKSRIPSLAGDPDAKSLKRDSESIFTFKFEIPVGPGKSRNKNAKGEAIGQTLENIIQNIDFGL